MLDSLGRPEHAATISTLLADFPVVAILGARQVGKTTLARAIAAGWPGDVTFFDLEDPESLARFAAPKLALESLRGLVVLDEVQRLPEVFPVLRVLADRPGTPARFLVLGSSSPELLRQSSETLAGRIAFHELGGFSLSEVSAPRLHDLWVRGGFPRSFLARDEAASWRWRGELTRTYLERDIPSYGFRLSPDTLRKFWTMVAHYHAQTWNGAELARALGVSESTVRHHLEILQHTFMARRLEPWFENQGKRLVKAPKVYLTDTGLLHRLLGIATGHDLLSHPKVGASWEGFAIEQVIARLGAERSECWFWGLHSGAELDLLVVRGERRLGFEVKLTDAPKVTPSMRSALEALRLDSLDVLHGGRTTFWLTERIRAVSLHRLRDDVAPL